MEGERMLKVPEVAKRLGLNPETIRRWLREGKLRGVLVGGTRGGYRVPESEVARVLTIPNEGEGEP